MNSKRWWVLREHQRETHRAPHSEEMVIAAEAQAEIDEWRRVAAETARNHDEDMTKAEAEIDRLRAALEAWVDWYMHDTSENRERAYDKTLAALKEST